MAIRKDGSIEITLTNIEKFKTKTGIRSHLFSTWILEKPQRKYRYYAETLPNNSRLYLERPGRLNKGCDFVIYIENILLWKNGNDKPPTHTFLLDDLRTKRNGLIVQQWQSLVKAIEVIYNLGTVKKALQLTNNLANNGLPMVTTLKLARWFFIEQDLTYWAKSGRAMLYNEIKKL